MQSKETLSKFNQYSETVQYSRNGLHSQKNCCSRLFYPKNDDIDLFDSFDTTQPNDMIKILVLGPGK